ncbi:MAG: hypothetical protein LBS96_09030 [Oscillospiraceae bacterium]|jgi:hypothetical protein|nr:hypothetical protein [Oscillospiraceae bacterium]
MKRILVLTLALGLLLSACGTAPVENATSTQAATATAPTQAPPGAEPPKPFTDEDISAIEAQFPTIGDYVQRVPALWYQITVWGAASGTIHVDFYDAKPESSSGDGAWVSREDGHPTLCLDSYDELAGYSDQGYFVGELTQTLPAAMLQLNAQLAYIDFSRVNLPLPRGLAIGETAAKLYAAYPDHRTPEQNSVLYDVTELYPNAKPEWGRDETTFLGGRINGDQVKFTYIKPDDPANPDAYVNPYGFHWELTYFLGEDEKIVNITYTGWAHES